MKKYLITAGLFVFNNEILSMLAVTIIAVMFVCAFLRDAAEGGMFD